MYPIHGRPEGQKYLESISSADAHRAPTPEGLKLIRAVRQRCFDTRAFIEVNFPPSRERSIALTRLDEMRMWLCNAATLDGKIGESLQVPPPEVVHVDYVPEPAPPEPKKLEFGGQDRPDRA